MKRIYLNLKRFDIPRERGGVNSLCDPREWGSHIVLHTQDTLQEFQNVEFVMFFPEAHLIPAITAKNACSPIEVGTQGLHWEDTVVGGAFGAFTTSLVGNAAASLGCTYALIGHCEERNKLATILSEAEGTDTSAINRILNKEILAAQKAGLKVLYCIGETDRELDIWNKVLGEQLSVGLHSVDSKNVVIAYEPIWSIGPGKVPADKTYITKVAKFVKEATNGLDVVYGGGLKADNAEMLASIAEIDGGLIALTRFAGEIGFYPDEYIDIIKRYIGAVIP
ncbi:MAG: triose-phosphate isomerase [Sphaerochaeta sp.]|jgi:triosephosphate isomerase|nr:triose-phosphate isomerase [Sphaerochaeta sp.]